MPRSSAATSHAHLEIYEPEAAVVRRIFTERAAETTIREICRQLDAVRVASPTGNNRGSVNFADPPSPWQRGTDENTVSVVPAR